MVTAAFAKTTSPTKAPVRRMLNIQLIEDVRDRKPFVIPFKDKEKERTERRKLYLYVEGGGLDKYLESPSMMN